MNKADTSIQQYIERARDIEDEVFGDRFNGTPDGNRASAIEVAKMIQAQEHFEAQQTKQKEE